jgi:hypothetical protein
MINRCWNCGKFTAPMSQYGAGRFEYLCHTCDVKWVTPEFWRESNVWKDHDGYAGYQAYRLRSDEAIMKTSKVELVDFSKPGAPSSPA